MSKMVLIGELAAMIKQIEGILVGLECRTQTRFRPYPMSIASPGRMRVSEWLEQFEKWYPEIEATSPPENLTLGELRVRYSEF
jgi:hypothetical protein